MRSLNISELKKTLNEASCVVYGDKFLVMDLSIHDGYVFKMNFPFRFEGVICAFCMGGVFKLTIGLDKYELREDNFAVGLPEDIISLKSINPEKGRLRVLAISNMVLEEMGFDIGRAQMVYKHRVIKANKLYKLKIHCFRNMFRVMIKESNEYTHKSLAFLFKAMETEMEGVWRELVDVPDNATPDSPVCDTFVAMVAKHHREHKDLEFYAAELSLTSKYMSNLIKKQTGKTAAQWIQEYVLLDARYYLTSTEMSVKEIAYEIGFRTQMDFYRYFQRHVGVAPSDYRRNVRTQQNRQSQK